MPKSSLFCQYVKPYQRNCTPFFYFSTINKPVITLKHTMEIGSDYKLKIKTALENAVNKPFSRAVLFIFSPAVPRTPRGYSSETYPLVVLPLLHNRSLLEWRNPGPWLLGYKTHRPCVLVPFPLQR